MASPTVFRGDVVVSGNVSAGTETIPLGAVGDPQVAVGARIQASKLQHQFEPVYSQTSTVNAAADRKVLHVVRGATGTLLDFGAGSITAAQAGSSCVVDLLKNGTTILTATVTLDNAKANFGVISPAGYTSTSLVVGDVLEVQVKTIVGGNPPVGVFARLALVEDATANAAGGGGSGSITPAMMGG
jgi:hypothetical protein